MRWWGFLLPLPHPRFRKYSYPIRSDIRIAINLGSGNAMDEQALLFEILLPRFILHRALCLTMHSAIDLNHQRRLETVKIQNVRPDRMLASEDNAITTLFQPLPQQPLRSRESFPHLPRQSDLFRCVHCLPQARNPSTASRRPCRQDRRPTPRTASCGPPPRQVGEVYIISPTDTTPGSARRSRRPASGAARRSAFPPGRSTRCHARRRTGCAPGWSAPPRRGLA